MSGEYRRLFRSDTMSVGDYRCSAPRGPERHTEIADAYEIAFVRRGIFTAVFPHARAYLLPTHVLLLRPGCSFTVEHPLAGGDECTVFRFTHTGWEDVPPELRDGFREIRAFAGAAAFMAHRCVISSLPIGDSLATEERAWAMISFLCADLTIASATPPSSRMRRAVAAAEELLWAHVGEPLPLRTIAKRASVSRFHLCRAFRAMTGVSMHRYQIALRLRIALERLEEGERDLTELALDLGFADHSHFCSAFHREFSMPPSAYRRLAVRERAALQSRFTPEPIDRRAPTARGRA